MKSSSFRGRCFGVIACMSVATVTAFAAGPYGNRDNLDKSDTAEGQYPMPYHYPKVEEVTAVLQRVHAHLEHAMTTGIIDSKTREKITDLKTPVATAVASRGEEDGFPQIAYATGVTYSGMLHAAEVTGDPRYKNFVAERLKFLAEAIPYFRAQSEKFGVPQNSYRALFATDSLDDSGSMAASLIKARLVGAGPDLLPSIEHWASYVRYKQFRIADGMLARQRPQPESLWADDAYMSIPALTQMGRLTGDRGWYDEAAKQTLLFAKHLFNAEKGLYMHGRNMNQPLNPEFYWGRANGWVILAQCELLDYLPEDHPDRPKILELYRAHVKALAQLQSGAGLWRQLLDKEDSFIESSCTAMFVYGIAHGVNRGWISPVAYGSVAQAGWLALEKQVNEKGQLENSCVGTTFASDAVYYYNRPVSAHHGHAYGPVLMAGAEIIRLLQNNGKLFDVKLQFRTYHYVPKKS
ncbi:glycoside hydrolase family 88/105 protein [Oleiharenicola lentus]|uniref:glycoside hydrolase family 88/105 protein n=1 Tax=Oleiharenicola lentus TaxID=2508720 RepID=UPI003F66754D